MQRTSYPMWDLCPQALDRGTSWGLENKLMLRFASVLTVVHDWKRRGRWDKLYSTVFSPRLQTSANSLPRKSIGLPGSDSLTLRWADWEAAGFINDLILKALSGAARRPAERDWRILCPETESRARELKTLYGLSNTTRKVPKARPYQSIVPDPSPQGLSSQWGLAPCCWLPEQQPSLHG